MLVLRCLMAGLLGVAAACALFAALVAATAPPAGGGGVGPCIDPVRVRHAAAATSEGARVGRKGPICCCLCPPRRPGLLTPRPTPLATFSPPAFALTPASFEPALERELVSGVDGERCGAAAWSVSNEAPAWPREADRRGVRRGAVLVALDVTARGVPENLSVVESSPAGVFDDAALRALKRWRYCPVIRDGRPIAREGLRVRLSFESER